LGKPVVGDVVVLPFPQTNLQAGKRRSVRLFFATQTNRTYRVQYVSEVTATNWTALGAALPGNGATQTVSDSVLGNANRFYRLEVSQ
jgi:hypothetical protein